MMKPGRDKNGTLAERARPLADANCRVHDMTNLYVASSSVFPTSSQAIPTLTIVAMALRLADHLGRFPA